ncbi:MAG: aminoacyl-tRNA hydrolase [Firmicutes bacterium]|nr:aminoacyl-tRNA hydrolase [Bacillota bacterium]
MKMIVGLGNPGAKYSDTRHNVGFMAVDKLAAELNTTVNKEKYKAFIGEATLGSEKVLLVLPQTYMNLSGDSVGMLSRWYKLSPDDIVVIYDDMDLPLGRMRIRPKGGAGGHNGIKSIISHLGTENFPRIRIGIGKGVEGREHVLGRFSMDERKEIDEILSNVIKAVSEFVNQDVNSAMNKYNC